MTLIVLPDAELVATSWLRGHADIPDAAHIGTELPAEPSWPVVRILRIGGAPAVAGWLDAPRLQVDVYHTTKQAAHDLARLAQAALGGLTGVHDEAVVTGVTDGVFRWNPDPQTDQPAYTFDVIVYLHPNPGDAGS